MLFFRKKAVLVYCPHGTVRVEKNGCDKSGRPVMRGLPAASMRSRKMSNR
jgi:hypothetical protein